MKHLLKISSRYLFTAILLLLCTLLLNVFFYIICGFQIMRITNRTISHIRIVAEELDTAGGQIILSDAGYDYLNQHYVWAMLLNDQGQVIWNWQLPDPLNHPYTAREIAVFSKWYLEDYPVTERITDFGLLVTAQEKDSVWKYNVSDSTRVIRFIAHMIPITMGFNLILILLIVFYLSFRFYHSLQTLEKGILDLSEQRTIHLPEKGTTELLARQLNRTSDILTRQKEQLKRRDDSRAAWIRGISHDIRTPLSLIMGYAGDLKEDPSLSVEQQRLAGIMEQQSLQIKRLIEDLNLTSRLEYEMQPLRSTGFKPSRLLRTIISDLYNRGISGLHAIDLYIDPDVEQITLTGDVSLLTRAFSNLIGNSIRHNPDGCLVTVTAYPQDQNEVCFQISDDGCGIPDMVIRTLTGALPDTEKAPHIMGLRIAWQVFRAHGWNMIFSDSHTIHILTKK